MAHVTVEDAAFLAGLTRAVHDMDGDGEQILHTVADQVVARARTLVRKRSGHLASTIDARFGRDARGPWSDVGSDERYAMYVEYGTFKDPVHPFMRPALGLAARAIRRAGGRATRQSPRARAFALRARKRTLIRGSLHRGAITGIQARQLSRQVTSTFRFRARRRR